MRFLRLSLSLACAGLALAGGPLRARPCELDNLPAATLLLPYFEVDLEDPGGRTTLVSIGNAANRATLVRAVLWTDYAVPTLAFDIYLTGHDVQSLNLRDLFNGILPRTADDDNDPGDTLSPQGALSADLSFPGCAGRLPLPPLPLGLLDQVRQAHLGESLPLFFNQCAGRFFGDGVARGYMTIDVVSRCSTLTPADPGYFGAGGVAAHDNVLWGDFYYVHHDQSSAQGENLVRIESFPGRFGAGSRTFYARYVGAAGTDGREPLPSTWSVRTIAGGSFDGGTEVIAWRDPGVAGATVTCGSRPSWYPQSQEALLFDEEENLFVPDETPIPAPPIFFPFPGATGTARVNDASSPTGALPTPFPFGWMLMRFTSGGTATAGAAAQGWMGSVVSGFGTYSVGSAGAPWDDGCQPAAPLEPAPLAAEVPR